MDGMLLPIAAAGSVALLAWWLAVLIAGKVRGEKRKLQERLGTEQSVPRSASGEALSVDLQGGREVVPEFLARKPLIQELQRRLTQAHPDTSLRKFLLLVTGLGAGGFLLPLAISGNLIISVALGLFCGYIPFFLLASKRGKRQRAITMQLPEALDFLSRIIRAGHSLTTGLQMMSEELPKPLCDEFRRAYDQHSLGQGLEDSLKDMAARIESTDFAFFVTAVLIQRQTGGDLSEVLTKISNVIRQRIHLSQSVRAKTAEGRFTGYIMVAFPAVLFSICYFLNPDYGNTLLHTNSGLKMLATAFGLQMSGLWLMKRITTVRV